MGFATYAWVVYLRERQFLGIYTNFRDSVGFCTLLYFLAFAKHVTIRMGGVGGWGGGYLLMHGWGACANTHPLMIFRKSAIPSAFISFRIVHPTRIRPNVKPSTLGGRGSIYGDMGGVVAQKTQFLSLYTKCCAARQLRPSSALFLFVFVSPLNHLRVGGWITYRGLGAVYAQNATPSSICPFCASVSFRQH